MEQGDRRPQLALRAVLLTLFVLLSRSLLVSLVMGAISAILLDGVSRWIGRRLGRARGYAPMITTFGVIVLLMLPTVFIFVQAFTALQELDFQAMTAAANRWATTALDRVSTLARGFNIGSARLRGMAGDAAPRIAGAVTGFVRNVAAALPSYLVDIFLFVIALYYFLRDGDRLQAWLHRVSPFAEGQTDELFKSVRDTVSGALAGTLAAAGVQGGITLIALLALQVPGAFLWALIAGLLSFIPMVGTTPITVGATIYLFASGRTVSAVIMIAVIVLVGVSDNIVRPWAQSSRGGMHPLLALVSLFGGIELFGPFGIFLGPVVSAMALWAAETHKQRILLREPSPVITESTLT